MSKRKLSRRTVLRGMIGGAAVSVGVPFLDCFLNTNGTALAAAGGPMPVRFGTWFWGCGMNAQRWVPNKLGADYDLPVELQAIEPFKRQVTVLSGFKVTTDGRTNHPHHTGTVALRTGVSPLNGTLFDAPTFDTAVAEAVGAGTRFRSLDVAATGNSRHSYSVSPGNAINPAEVSPLALYQRVFGPEFQDPNAAEFKPDPRTMVRQSVLSAVREEREDLLKRVGSADRIRLDQYFTSVRQLEQQVALQLQKPPPAEACKIPTAPAETKVGTDIDMVISNHKLMANLIAMALACNQTKVFNVVFSDYFSSLRRAGVSSVHHTLTHEEPVDPQLGIQPQASWFIERSMEAWATFLQAMSSIREGDGTLLDHSLILAHSDVETARIHAIVGIPMMIAGTAGGKVRSGLHIDGRGNSVTRVGLTMQQLMGVPLDSWGSGSMKTSSTLSEIIV